MVHGQGRTLHTHVSENQQCHGNIVRNQESPGFRNSDHTKISLEQVCMYTRLIHKHDNGELTSSHSIPVVNYFCKCSIRKRCRLVTEDRRCHGLSRTAPAKALWSLTRCHVNTIVAGQSCHLWQKLFSCVRSLVCIGLPYTRSCESAHISCHSCSRSLSPPCDTGLPCQRLSMFCQCSVSWHVL